MAGANNAQLKRDGWKAADITKARATHGALSHAAMAREFTPKKYSHAHKKIAEPATKARDAAAKAAEHKATDLATRRMRTLSATMMANRKAQAAKAADAAKTVRSEVPRMRQAKSVKATQAAKLSHAPKLSKEDRITILAARLYDRIGSIASPQTERRRRARERLNILESKYREQVWQGRELRAEMHFDRAKANNAARGLKVTRRQFGLGPRDDRTTMLLNAMRR